MCEHYDAAGVLTGTTVTRRQAEWTPDARDKALALTEYEAGLCPGCARPLAETTDPLMEGRYRPDGFVQCFRCTALHQIHRKHQDHEDSHAFYHQIEALPPRKHRPGEAPPT